MPPITVKLGYQPQSLDTSPEIDVLMFDLLRQLSPPQKLERVRSFHQAVRRLAIAGIENQYPHASRAKLRQEFIKRCLGGEWLEVLGSLLNTRDWGELVIVDPIALAEKLAEIFAPLNISYVVGGSVASSLLGENRSTQDLDVVIDLDSQIVPGLIKAMAGEFCISESAVSEAIAKAQITPRESSFNVTYLPSLEKVDIFVMSRNDLFSREVMDRRRLYAGIYIYSPEDIILQKLSWYGLISGGSQKQWRDVLGVLKVQGDAIDRTYLTQGAATLHLTDLLNTALLQSGQ